MKRADWLTDLAGGWAPLLRALFGIVLLWAALRILWVVVTF